ncbi:hypothetical protein GCM10025883_20980 [Mobilicoccus caccae]|uniref:Uncharacterized protein n=1 Tax=Mobilicoccus caccae TaxID=1859295 RepID=A0ABQ6ITN6_9MICO|nr:hypothetical protein GCM10025883_20980 [Mobilicoccus caccae]
MLLIGVEDVGRRRPVGLVHAHVQRRVGAVGETPVDLVELEGGDAEVEEHPVEGTDAHLGQHLGDLVVHGVDRGEPVAEPGESLPRQVDGLRVAVQADHPRRRARLEDRLGVATHAERGVETDGALALQRRSEQLHDAVAHHRHVPVRGVARRRVHPVALLSMRGSSCHPVLRNG